jgi:diguanylate cyclase (GGDEF)-like protein/PAS domain S-box-containing protein
MRALSAFIISTILLYPLPAISNEQVTLQLRWLHQAQFAGYYMAKEKGFYAQAGLDVNILPANPSNPVPMEKVLTNQAQFGVGNAGLIAAYLAGKPVVAMAAIFQRSPNIWLTLADSPIYNLTYLAQSRLMMTRSVENAELLAMFQQAGIKLDKLKLLPSSFNINDLLANKTDAFNAYITNEPFALQERGIDYRIFDPQSYGLDFYSDVLFTSQDFLKQKPKTVAAFYEASLKGWLYALEHLEETQQVIEQRYNDQHKSSAHIAYELNTVRSIIIPDLIQLGHMNPDRWQKIATVFYDLDLATNPHQNLDAFLYEPHPQINLQGYYWLVALLLAALSLVLIIALIFRRYNRQLTEQVGATQKAQQKLQRERDQLDAVLNNIADGVITMDANKIIKQVNAAATDLLGISEQQLIGQSNSQLNFFSLVNNARLQLAPNNTENINPIQGEACYQHPKLDTRIAHYSCAPVYNKKTSLLEGYVLTFQDITDKHFALSEAHKQAQHDPLTGLPNRLLLQDRLHQLIALAKRNETQVAVIFMDLDRFKPVNDTYGHAAGDQVLIDTARRLIQLIRSSDTVARLGGDEFVILLGCLESPQDEINQLAQRILDDIKQPIYLANVEEPIYVGSSLGIALYPKDGIDPDILLRRADIAMYQAKEAGRNCWRFATPSS